MTERAFETSEQLQERVQAAWDVAALGVKGDAAGEYNKTGLAEAALRYNASWAGYTGYLLSCPTVRSSSADA